MSTTLGRRQFPPCTRSPQTPFVPPSAQKHSFCLLFEGTSSSREKGPAKPSHAHTEPLCNAASLAHPFHYCGNRAWPESVWAGHLTLGARRVVEQGEVPHWRKFVWGAVNRDRVIVKLHHLRQRLGQPRRTIPQISPAAFLVR